MEKNNEPRPVQKDQFAFIEQLLDVEELESKLAPGGGGDIVTIHVNP